IYKYIKECKNVTLNRISSLVVNHLDVKEEYVEKILNGLIDLGFIYKYDIGDKIFYSTKDITNKIKLEKAQKPSTEDDIDINDPEINKFLNKKPLPDIPEKVDTNGTENNVELHSGEPDDIENNLPNEDESDFDLDKYMSEEGDSNHN
ncbi:MAG: hypothetical protein ACE5GV_09600, partial [Candidatus Scalindua sp.]